MRRPQLSKSLTGICVFLILSLNLSCQKTENQIIGVKIYEQKAPFDNLISQWKKLGINTAFTSITLLSNNEFRVTAKENDISIFVILPIFFDEETLKNSPELFAITDKGKEAQQDWVKFICPSQSKYRNQKLAEIENIIRDYNPDGISIDFIRHFIFWEMIYPDRTFESLPNSCFCDLCLAGFQSGNNIEIPSNIISTAEKADWIYSNNMDKWTSWKCTLITSMIEEITVAAKQIKPDILINVHIVPWTESDFGGAIKKVAGQDISTISEHTNYLSPMTYAHMVKQTPTWVNRIVAEMNKKAANKILPSIQVSKAYLNTPITNSEFEKTLYESLKLPSRGVVFWSWEKLAQDSAKMEIIQKIVKRKNSDN